MGSFALWVPIEFVNRRHRQDISRMQKSEEGVFILGSLLAEALGVSFVSEDHNSCEVALKLTS